MTQDKELQRDGQAVALDATWVMNDRAGSGSSAGRGAVCQAFVPVFYRVLFLVR
jgi:hypothetical protein